MLDFLWALFYSHVTRDVIKRSMTISHLFLQPPKIVLTKWISDFYDFSLAGHSILRGKNESVSRKSNPVLGATKKKIFSPPKETFEKLGQRNTKCLADIFSVLLTGVKRVICKTAVRYKTVKATISCRIFHDASSRITIVKIPRESRCNEPFSHLLEKWNILKLLSSSGVPLWFHFISNLYFGRDFLGNTPKTTLHPKKESRKKSSLNLMAAVNPNISPKMLSRPDPIQAGRFFA